MRNKDKHARSLFDVVDSHSEGMECNTVCKAAAVSQPVVQVFKWESEGVATKGNSAGRKGKFSNVATARQLKEILERQEYRCALSGVKLEPQDASLDHVIPVSQGGSNSADNLQFLHKDVNRAKATMSQQDFIKMCARVAEYSR